MVLVSFEGVSGFGFFFVVGHMCVSFAGQAVSFLARKKPPENNFVKTHYVVMLSPDLRDGQASVT